ncbi:hypothetical protein [Streptomyces olivochromogenes]|uniref:hypothetical protein n=1 Tax=Streptomyces olivochromogenes TaxID=1963 RepID=UPI001F319FC9|nr:hypothetical protein [Streptomyces olivochromogenes]MCF3135876.1 hypothetical protein [Streptomyces olivochromogenes]
MPFEYAATLGIIDVQFICLEGARDDFWHMWGADWLKRLSRYDELIAIRLNPLGAYATGRADNYRPGPAPASGGGAWSGFCRTSTSWHRAAWPPPRR